MYNPEYSRNWRIKNKKRLLKMEADYRKKNKAKIKEWEKNCWREKRELFTCCVCGFGRTIDFCHILWRKDGGKVRKDNITILCPNHHRLYDKGLLTKQELKLIKTVKEMYN
jgi:hypothetical protein